MLQIFSTIRHRSFSKRTQAGLVTFTQLNKNRFPCTPPPPHTFCRICTNADVTRALVLTAAWCTRCCRSPASAAASSEAVEPSLGPAPSVANDTSTARSSSNTCAQGGTGRQVSGCTAFTVPHPHGGTGHVMQHTLGIFPPMLLRIANSACMHLAKSRACLSRWTKHLCITARRRTVSRFCVDTRSAASDFASAFKLPTAAATATLPAPHNIHSGTETVEHNTELHSSIINDFKHCTKI